jgi:hypothetical protein
MAYKDNETKKAYYRAYYQRQKKDKLRTSKRLAYERAYYEAKKDELLAKRMEYARTIKGRYTTAKANAKIRDIAFELSFQEYASVMENGLCHYCGRELDDSGSGLDRRNNEAVYNVATAVPCCYRCNVTFNRLYNYAEKMMLAKAIRDIDLLRTLA